MERSGMRVLQLQAIGGSPEVLADVFAKNVKTVANRWYSCRDLSHGPSRH